MDVSEKLKKEESKLSKLKAQRNELDEKIKKVENEISNLQNILQQKKFNELTQVFTAKGLTVEEIMQAVASGDMLSLQERIEKKESEKTENSDSVIDSDIIEEM